jgi:hypothetical protein
MRGLRAGSAIAALAYALASTGCSAERVNGLRPSPQGPGGPVPAAMAPGACAFSIQSVEDLRDDKALGRVAFTRVDGDHFAAWFAEALKSVPGYQPQPATLVMKVEILKAYIQSLATMKSANLVVRVHVAQHGHAPRTKLYRGVDNSTNWSSSEDEIQAAFDSAMAHLQRQMAADLATGCPRPRP